MWAALITGLCRVVVSTPFIVVYVLLLVTAAVAVYVSFHKKISSVRRDLAQATRGLERIENERGFLLSFGEFDASMRAFPALAAIWNRYKEQLIHPSPPKDEQAIRKTQESSAFFNPATLLIPRMNMHLYSSVPNYLTGAGILGTFAGLAAGIYLASRGLGADDVASVMSALSDLLSAASMKFVTSLSGLGLSIALSILEKLQIGGLDKDVEKWTSELDRRVRLITAERISHEQLGELREQTGQLARFNTDLAVRMGDAVGERMNERIVPNLSKLVEAIEALRSDWKHMNMGALENMLGTFKDSLTRSAGTEFQAMSQTLATLNKVLGTTTQSLTASHATIRQHLHTSTDEVRGAVTEVARSTEGMVVLSSRWTELVQRMEGIIKPVMAASNSLQSAGEHVESVVRRNADIAEQMGRAAGQFRDSQDMMAKSWGEYRDRFEGVDGSLKKVFVEMNLGLVKFAGTVNEFMVGVDGHLSKALENLSAVINELKETAESLDETLKESRR